MKQSVLILLASLISLGAWSQKYKNGGVAIRNAKGMDFSESYHKLQVGVLLPGSMAARKNVWYTKELNPSISGNAQLPALNIQYAWSSNRNTEFIIHGGYEQVKYFNESDITKADHSRNFGYLLIGMNYKWWQKKSLVLYSGLMLGGGVGRYALMKGDHEDLSFETDRENWIYPSAQLTALGFTWGKRVGLFGEIAFGSKGVFTGGVYCKF